MPEVDGLDKDEVPNKPNAIRTSHPNLVDRNMIRIRPTALTQRKERALGFRCQTYMQRWCVYRSMNLPEYPYCKLAVRSAIRQANIPRPRGLAKQQVPNYHQQLGRPRARWIRRNVGDKARDSA